MASRASDRELDIVCLDLVQQERPMSALSISFHAKRLVIAHDWRQRFHTGTWQLPEEGGLS